MALYKNQMVYRFMCIVLLVCLFIIPLGTVSIHAEATDTDSYTTEFTYNDLEYLIDTDSLTAVLAGSVSDELKSLKIPSVIIYKEKEIPVTGIADYAFEGSSLTKVTIGKNVRTIGEGAFAFSSELIKVSVNKSCNRIGDAAFFMCEKLKTVKLSKKAKTSYIGEGALAGTAIKKFSIPDATVTVGSAAFAECPKLSSVNLGKKLNELGEGAFAGCNSLEKVSISDKNKSFTVKDNLIYSKDYEELLSAAAASGEIRLSEETESIACRAFEGNSRVVTVRIPESVASIEECAFMSCSALETVILEGGMIEIDENAFYDCPGLKEMRLGG